MKKVFLLLAAALVTVVSCEQTPNEDKPIDQPIENPILSTTTGSGMSISFIGETCDVEYTLTGVSEGKKPEASATEAWVKNVTVGKSAATGAGGNAVIKGQLVQQNRASAEHIHNADSRREYYLRGGAEYNHFCT